MFPLLMLLRRNLWEELMMFLLWLTITLFPLISLFWMLNAMLERTCALFVLVLEQLLAHTVQDEISRIQRSLFQRLIHNKNSSFTTQVAQCHNLLQLERND
jgi:hypothetical protein